MYLFQPSKRRQKRYALCLITGSQTLIRLATHLRSSNHRVVVVLSHNRVVKEMRLSTRLVLRNRTVIFIETPRVYSALLRASGLLPKYFLARLFNSWECICTTPFSFMRELKYIDNRLRIPLSLIGESIGLRQRELSDIRESHPEYSHIQSLYWNDRELRNVLMNADSQHIYMRSKEGKLISVNPVLERELREVLCLYGDLVGIDKLIKSRADMFTIVLAIPAYVESGRLTRVKFQRTLMLIGTYIKNMAMKLQACEPLVLYVKTHPSSSLESKKLTVDTLRMFARSYDKECIVQSIPSYLPIEIIYQGIARRKIGRIVVIAGLTSLETGRDIFDLQCVSLDRITSADIEGD